MQFSKGGMETVRRQKKAGCVARAKSLDSIRPAELTPPEIRILLSPHNNDFASTVARQQLLADKHLFDPFKYFGSPNFYSFEDSLNFHSRRLTAMFTTPAAVLHARTPVKIALKGSLGRSEQSSPLVVGKVREGTKGGRGKSPKGYVKENKQNFMRLNLNNMQKMRVKLKLNKK